MKRKIPLESHDSRGIFGPSCFIGFKQKPSNINGFLILKINFPVFINEILAFARMKSADADEIQTAFV